MFHQSLRSLSRATALAVLLFLASSLPGCGGPQSPGTAAPPDSPPEPVHVTLIQLNDIYEITPVSGGRWGGPARVATVRRELLKSNPNTYTILAGDLFSPSALGTARVGGERLAGRQMVAVLNQMGLDYATFGNHEFDLNEEQFLDRLDESEFEWFSTNVTDDEGMPFPGVDKHLVLAVSDESGRQVRIGMIGLCFDGIDPDYVEFLDPVETAREEIEFLAGRVDAIVAITHLPVEQDVYLAQSVPEIDLILGGHEHENMRLFRGQDLTPILKADANVRTLYVHDLFFDPVTGGLEIESRLLPITDAIPDDPATAAVAEEWVEVGFAGFRESGFDPWEVVAEVPTPLDGLEASVRNHPTPLTYLIANGMLADIDGAEGALLNSGSIRIDDVVSPGPISQYDVIRILPFGGPVLEVEMRGDLLLRVLDQGERNQGGGGYLQLANIQKGESGEWLVGGDPVERDRPYLLAVSDYLVSGNEQGFEFLHAETPGLRVVSEGRDVRMTLIEELKRTFGSG
ncbi:MAG: bifunctional metallophosphatase/5'-nucleotidase [Gemmatimonadetes bacterium]|nr:bifunctional metallophosphatase/5'-nucleotidase [Gemmatimonadota bacterium]